MEIRRAAQVVVLGRDPLGFGRRWLDEIAAIGQDVAHMAVVPGASSRASVQAASTRSGP